MLRNRIALSNGLLVGDAIHNGSLESVFPFGTTRSIAFQPIELPVLYEGDDDFLGEPPGCFNSRTLKLAPKIS